ncbi:MAG: DNA primase [Phycisphaerales bacterium]
MATSGFHNDRERVLDATNIVDLIGEQLRLVPKGREFVCLCPFHEDSKPSMYVVPHKQIYHCFACGAGGNALDFTMNYHAMGFVEALKHLAERSGVELTPWKGTGQQPGEPNQSGISKEELLKANAFALSFYRTIFRHQQHGTVAREIAEKRGLTPEVIDQFQIGAAPDRFDGLLSAIQAKSLKPAPFVELGLLKTKESGGHYDALRNRLIFPILDQMNRPIAFGGRIINPDDTPKYLNSPETRLFHKSSTLYGIHAAFQAIKSSRVAIITEGYTDVIACHKAGFQNVVATLGTALTPKHASILKRVADTVVLLFDGDEAGQRASDRAVEVFFREPVDVKIATLPGGKDPDELLAEEGGPALFDETIDAAEDAMAFRFARLERKLQMNNALPGTEARSRAVEEELSRIVSLGLNDLTPVRKQTILRKLASIAKVDARAILEQAEHLGRRNRGGHDRWGLKKLGLQRDVPDDGYQHDWTALCGPAGIGVGPINESRVNSITAFEDEVGPALMIGGRFQKAGGLTANHIARWNGTRWSTLDAPRDTGVSHEVHAITIFEGAIHACGAFNRAGGGTVNRVAKWDGTNWHPLQGPCGTGLTGDDLESNIRSTCSALAVFDDGSGPALYAAGRFHKAGGIQTSNIAKWDGEKWSMLAGKSGIGLNSPALALAPFESGKAAYLCVGGIFSEAAGDPAAHIALWDGTRWHPMRAKTSEAELDNWVHAVAVFDDGSGPALYAGGDFRKAGNADVNHIAKWDGRRWWALREKSSIAGTSGPIHSLTVFDDGSGPALYAGGNFERAGKTVVNNIAKWNGRKWTPLTGANGIGTEGVVDSLAGFDDGNGPALYVGGQFKKAGGIVVNRIARWGRPHVPESAEEKQTAMELVARAKKTEPQARQDLRTVRPA